MYLHIYIFFLFSWAFVLKGYFLNNYISKIFTNSKKIHKNYIANYKLCQNLFYSFIFSGFNVVFHFHK